MRVTRHYSHKQIIHDYTLHQQTLENVQSAKYLGITITENMDWGQHISDILSKATKTLGVLRRLHTKLWYALNWSMQPPFGALIVKLRFNKWRRYRGRQPAGHGGGGATLLVLEKCSMSCNGQLWRPGGISPLCFSSTRFIVGLCLLIKTSTWPRLRVQDLPGHHTTHSIAGPRLIVMPWSILFSQGLFLIGIVWLHLWSQLRPQRSSGHSLRWLNQKLFFFFFSKF